MIVRQNSHTHFLSGGVPQVTAISDCDLLVLEVKSGVRVQGPCIA